MNKLNLPENLIRLRHERKLTQEELADFIGVTKASVSKWEKGINTPDLMLLPQLAAYFDVTVDELIGYEARLSGEQIRRQYAELSKEFATLPLADVLGKIRVLAHKYYACYPFLLQLGILYLNHYMLAETEDGRKALLLEAVEALEPSAEPGRLAAQYGILLVQAYQSAGDTEKARSYAQVKQYLDLLAFISDAVLALSLNEQDMDQCEETIRRITGIIELFHLEALHPNLAAQFHFQAAIVYAVNGREEEALGALHGFEGCVDRLIKAKQIKLQGDEYFNRLEAWIERLPLGNMAPRDKSFIRQSVGEALAHPAFGRLKEREEFQRLADRLTGGNSYVKDGTFNQAL